MKAEIRGLKIPVSHLTAAVKNCNRRTYDLAAWVEAVECYQRNGAAATTSSLEVAISELKLELNDRDQEPLSNDIEITIDSPPACGNKK